MMGSPVQVRASALAIGGSRSAIWPTTLFPTVAFAGLVTCPVASRFERSFHLFGQFAHLTGHFLGARAHRLFGGVSRDLVGEEPAQPAGREESEQHPNRRKRLLPRVGIRALERGQGEDHAGDQHQYGQDERRVYRVQGCERGLIETFRRKDGRRPSLCLSAKSQDQDVSTQTFNAQFAMSVRAGSADTSRWCDCRRPGRGRRCGRRSSDRGDGHGRRRRCGGRFRPLPALASGRRRGRCGGRRR